jgi:hypothetical protein
MSNAIDDGDLDQSLAEEIQEGADAAEAERAKESARKPTKAAPAKTAGGFQKAGNPKESTYNGENLWTLSYDQWFDILTGLAKNNPKATGTDKKSWAFDGVRLWTSSWDDKYAMLEALVK